MARIPTYVSTERVGGGLPTGAGLSQASPEAFGSLEGAARAQGGADLQRVGAATTQLGVQVGDFVQSLNEKQNKLDAANAIGKFDFTGTFYELQKTTADPKEFVQNVANTYSEKVDEYINGLDVNEDVRTRIKTTLNAQRPSYIAQATGYATKALDAKDRLDSNEALTLQQNTVRADASIETYAQAVAKSNAIIDAQPHVTEVEKQGMRQQSMYDLGRRRFESMISAAEDDPTALQGIKNEMTEGDFWKGKLASQDYARLLDDVDRKMNAANSGEAATGRAAIQSVKQRNTDGVVIDPVELQAATVAVAASKRPELISQMAMINKQQSIYRDGKGLPLSEQRAQRDKAMTAKGVSALPAVVQEGIAGGSTATNGVISTEFLAGLVNAEYGHLIGNGDYGQRTGNKTSSGAPGSDATGIAQFTGPTFLNTVRRHASELGVTAALSDAAILEMRKDPKFALKAAALHALDNKTILEGVLGRAVTDGDLYFAHFLGAAGAKRFLVAADANPKGLATANVAPEQVDANRNVFFDNGKPRTNEQVRAYMSNAMMNGPSRVDYAGVKAWDTVIKQTEKALRDDPITFARTTQRFADVGDVSTPEGMGRRGVVAQQVAEYYGVPTRDFKPFTKEEVEQLGKRVQDGTADETIGVLTQVTGLGGDMAKAGYKQLGEKDTIFGYAAGLSSTLGQTSVASDIIRGEKRLKEDKDVLTRFGNTEPERAGQFEKIVGKALAATTQGTTIRKAADALYVERELSRGASRAGRFDADAYERSVNAVLGGEGSPDKKAIGNVNGAAMLLPTGVTADVFDGALATMTEDDYSRLSKWGGPPLYTDGKPAKARDIAYEGRFEAVGAGEYRIKMADDTYLLSGVTTVPGGQARAVPFIFRGDPAAIREFAARRSGSTVMPDVPLSP